MKLQHHHRWKHGNKCCPTEQREKTPWADEGLQHNKWTVVRKAFTLHSLVMRKDKRRSFADVFCALELFLDVISTRSCCLLLSDWVLSPTVSKKHKIQTKLKLQKCYIRPLKAPRIRDLSQLQQQSQPHPHCRAARLCLRSRCITGCALWELTQEMEEQQGVPLPPRHTPTPHSRTIISLISPPSLALLWAWQQLNYTVGSTGGIAVCERLKLTWNHLCNLTLKRVFSPFVSLIFTRILTFYRNNI